LFLLIAANVFAQTDTNAVGTNAVGTSLATEIQNIEIASVRQGASANERFDALVRLARLRQLSGDIEGAAKNWLEAATVIPGSVDDEALLACAYCLAAMGEWDRAAVALQPLLTKNIRARFLDIGINAIKTGDTSALAAIAGNSEYSGLRHEIFFFLWKISKGEDAERWRVRLTLEFPLTPEGQLALKQKVLSPNPFWFFISGLDSLPLLARSERGSGQGAVSSEQGTVSSGQGAVSSEQRGGTQVSSEQRGSGAQVQRLQTGVFGREVNAQSQAAALRQAGFSPSIERRGDMWAVTVPAGSDSSRTISSLRAAGFDSFLVR